MHNFGEEPDWEPLDLDGALWVSAALLGVLLVHLLIRLCSGFTDKLVWVKAWTRTRLVNILFSVLPEGTGKDSQLDIERRLGKIEHTLYDIREFMEHLQTEFRDIKATAVEAIELPNNVCEVLVDIEDTMKTLAPKLERLVGVVKHRIDNQNSVLQCMYYSLDEQFLLLCDLTPSPLDWHIGPEAKGLDPGTVNTIRRSCIEPPSWTKSSLNSHRLGFIMSLLIWH